MKPYKYHSEKLIYTQDLFSIHRMNRKTHIRTHQLKEKQKLLMMATHQGYLLQNGQKL